MKYLLIVERIFLHNPLQFACSDEPTNFSTRVSISFKLHNLHTYEYKRNQNTRSNNTTFYI